jgi:flagellin
MANAPAGATTDTKRVKTMALTVNTNIASLTAQRNLTGSQTDLSTSLQRLSSGLRINSAKDDAAGLAISERFTAQIKGLNVGIRNASDGISLAQTAEGALAEVTNNLQRIRELAVQSANATNSASDRTALQAEVTQLIAEIDRVAGSANFNNVNLLDGSFANQSFQVGPGASDQVTVSSIVDGRTSSLGSNVASLTGGTKLGGVSAVSDGLNDIGAVVSGDNFKITTADGGATAAITYAADAEANAIASAINTATGLANNGVTATATNSATLSSLDTAGDVTFTLEGTSISATVADVNDLTTLKNAINGASGTGITASFTTTGSKSSLTLSTTDGRDINLQSFAVSGASNANIDFSGQTLTEGGTVAAVKVGDISLSSTKGAITLTNPDATLTNVVSGSFSDVESVTVADASSATSALAVIDSAIDQVNAGRADLGAIQNRFESVVTSLQVTSENLSASRSRIVDADFASETAQLTKAQILQQSGIAMLAQANAIPQNVLALLQ